MLAASASDHIQVSSRPLLIEVVQGGFEIGNISLNNTLADIPLYLKMVVRKELNLPTLSWDRE